MTINVIGGAVKRLSGKKLELIANSVSSVREAARHYNVSPTTVVKFRKLKKSEEPLSKDTALPEHLRLLLAEMVRLSRYPQNKWIEFLGDLLPKMPTAFAERQNLLVRNMPEPKTTKLRPLWAKSQLYSNLRRELGDGRHANGWPPEKGVCAVHLVHVVWKAKGNDEKMEKADVLCLMERFTGMVYLKAYNRLQSNGVKKSILSFLSIYQMDFSKFVIVGMPSQGNTSLPGQNESKACKLSKSKISVATLDDYDSSCARIINGFKKIGGDYSDKEFEIEKPLGLLGRKKIELPWTFTNLEDLNQKLVKLADRYNQNRRSSEEHSKIWALYTPRERLWDAIRIQNGHYSIRRKSFDAMATIDKARKPSKAADSTTMVQDGDLAQTAMDS